MITIAVIGVVAAITFPSVIQKQQNKATVAMLEKAYSILQQALIFAKEEHENIVIGFKFQNVQELFFSYIKPYLNIIKECENKTNSGCWAEETFSLSGDIAAWNSYPGQVGDEAYVFVLNDGISVNIDILGKKYSYIGLPAEIDDSYMVVFDIDINGLKGPNKWGRDIFVFAISNTQEKLVPFGVIIPADVFQLLLVLYQDLIVLQKF